MLAIIQARMSSTRLPGKVLRLVAGKPLLKWVYDRLSSATHVSRLVVATSDSTSDDPIEGFCRENSILLFRGSLKNVARRLLDCARDQGAAEFVRISGDSPLIDPTLVNQAIELKRQTSCDLSTNVQFRSFPKGQSVEVTNVDALARAIAHMRDPRDVEHVTRYFYSNPGHFLIENFSSETPMAHVQLSVDTAEDLMVADRVLIQLGERFSWREAVEAGQAVLKGLRA